MCMRVCVYACVCVCVCVCPGHCPHSSTSECCFFFVFILVGSRMCHIVSTSGSQQVRNSESIHVHAHVHAHVYHMCITCVCIQVHVTILWYVYRHYSSSREQPPLSFFGQITSMVIKARSNGQFPNT